MRLCHLIFLIFLLQSCNGQDKPKKLEHYPMIPTEKQVSYVLHVSSINPYEIYFDDIRVGRNYDKDVINRSIEINPYVLTNGKYKIKMRFFSPLESSPFHQKDGLLSAKDIINSEDARFNIYFTPVFKDPDSALGYKGSIDYTTSKLPITLPPDGQRVPFWENEWEVEVKNLPYDVKGWSDGEDLRKWDKDKLHKEVFAFYEKIRKSLNDGNINEFNRMNEIRDKEEYLVTYMTPEQIEISRQRNDKNLVKECTGNMVPLDGAVIRLYGHGKLARLETPFGEYKGWNAIASKSEVEGYNSYGIMIYKPKESKDFVIIRK